MDVKKTNWIYIVLVFILVIACGKSGNDIKNPTNVEDARDHIEKINVKKGKLKPLSSKEQDLVKDWVAFNNLYQGIKKLNNTARHSIAQDLLQANEYISDLEGQSFPEEFNLPQIKSRLLVLQTLLLKLRDDAIDASTSNEFIISELVKINKTFQVFIDQIVEISGRSISIDEVMEDAEGEDLEEKDTKAEPLKKEAKKEKAPQKTTKKLVAKKFETKN